MGACGKKDLTVTKNIFLPFQKDTTVTHDKIMVLSGLLAVSNMGQELPGVNLTKRAKEANTDWKANSIAIFFAEKYMETNEDERNWTKEVRFWVVTLKKMTDEEVVTRWPDVAQRYDEAV